MTVSDAIASVQEALEGFVEAEHLPGYVAGVSIDGETAIRAAGTLALGSDEPMGADTVFRIASLSKPVGAALALTLIQAGTIAIDDEVSRWLPELAAPRVLRSRGARAR